MERHHPACPLIVPSQSVPGGAARIKILDCTLTRAVGDGIAISPTDAQAASGEEVSDVRIASCSFIGRGKCGTSNQRSARLVQILHTISRATASRTSTLEPTKQQLTLPKAAR